MSMIAIPHFVVISSIYNIPRANPRAPRPMAAPTVLMGAGLSVLVGTTVSVLVSVRVATKPSLPVVTMIATEVVVTETVLVSTAVV
jgi:hypothetical protein